MHRILHPSNPLKEKAPDLRLLLWASTRRSRLFLLKIDILSGKRWIFRAMRLDMIQNGCRLLCMTFTAVSDWGAFVGVLCLGKGMIGQMCVQMQENPRPQV